jgi:CzcA family heavy metal efflux pump
MPVSLFPDITFPRIVILADVGETPANRMMIEVTKPLEEVASSLPGVGVVRSVTGRGSAEISINMDWGSAIDETVQTLQGRVADIRSILPPSTQLKVQQMRASVYPIQGYSLLSSKRSLVELRDIALHQIRPALMRVPGVASVEITGGDVREFVATIDPVRLANYGLNVNQVVDAVGRSNVVASTGISNNNHQSYLALVSETLTSVEEIGAVVIENRNGVPIHVADVATVTTSVADRTIRTTAHGREAVLVNILRQPTGSTVEIGRSVTELVRHLGLPGDVTFESFYDQSNFISDSIASTRDSIVIGIILAMAVLVLFLRSWRIVLVIAIIAPTTVAVTFLVLGLLGLSINIMTLGGVAAAIGLVIDDVIVVLEGIFAQFESGADDGNNTAGKGTIHNAVSSAAERSLQRIIRPIIGSTASTLVIHIPLAFLGGLTGAFFASLSITMVVALILSFFFSISLAPLIATGVIRSAEVRREQARELKRGASSKRYERFLGSLLRRRWLILPIILLLVGATWLMYQRVGSDFMPTMDEGEFVLDYESPPGTSLDETDRVLRQLESELATVPEIAAYSRRTGTQLGFFLTEQNRGDYLVRLKKERSRSVDEITDELRGRIESKFPTLRVEFGQLMQDIIGDLTNSPSPIEIKLFGNDQQVLEATARRMKDMIETLPGVVDAFNGIVVSGPALTIDLDPTRTAIAGLDAAEVARQLETVMRGSVASRLLRGENVVDLRIRYPEAYRNDIGRLSGVVLMNPQSVPVPLGRIAEIKTLSGQSELNREGLRRMVAVHARLSSGDLGSAIAAIRAKQAKELPLPPGVTLEFGGLYQTQQESFRGLLFVGLAAFGLVFIVLLLEFREFAVPVAILVLNVLSLFGVVAALWITGETFNISSLVGTIMIIGIVAENAIFIMHEVHEFERDGMALNEAIAHGVTARQRPIMMTSIAAILALAPLALGIGAGAQMQRPLAIAVIGGLAASSILLFFILPVVYRMLRRTKAAKPRDNRTR